MSQFLKELNKELKTIRLKAAERRALKESVLSYMEYHPMQVSATKVKLKKVAKRKKVSDIIYTEERFAYIKFNKWIAAPALGGLALLFFVVVPVAAERAVPGDALYPVKVRINEEIFSTLSFTSFQKVEWETRRVERRIAEARLLASEGKLTDEVEAAITETVKTHTENAQKSLDALRESDAEEAAIAQIVLESTLDVQTAVLDQDSSNGGEEGDEQIAQLSTVVKEARAQVGVHGEGQEPKRPSYERLSARVEQATTRAHELFVAINGSASDEERAEIDRRMADIGRLVTVAGHMQEIGDNERAIEGLENALRDTQKLIVFMTDLDIRNAIELEILVPKKLTEDERAGLVAEALQNVKNIRDLVTAKHPSAEDEGLIEKVGIGLEELNDLITTVDLHASEGDIDEAEKVLREAVALANDLELLVDHIPTPQPEVEGEAEEANEEDSEEEGGEESAEGEEGESAESEEGEVLGENDEAESSEESTESEETEAPAEEVSEEVDAEPATEEESPESGE